MTTTGQASRRCWIKRYITILRFIIGGYVRLRIKYVYNSKVNWRIDDMHNFTGISNYGNYFAFQVQ